MAKKLPICSNTKNFERSTIEFHDFSDLIAIHIFKCQLLKLTGNVDFVQFFKDAMNMKMPSEI